MGKDPQADRGRARQPAGDRPARRGVVLSLVASVASTYLQLVGLDEQLVISKRTLGTYAESVKLFELQKKYGQVSKMNVEQARSQYETAAAQIPLIENQIAQTEQALSVLLGRNPGPITRGKTLDTLQVPRSPPAFRPSCSSAAPIWSNPSSSSSPPTRRSVRRRRSISRPFR